MTELVRHGNKSIKKHNLISRNYLLEFGNFNIVFLLCNCTDFLSKENRWIMYENNNNNNNNNTTIRSRFPFICKKKK